MAVALGSMILYYIILGETMGHLFAQIFVEGSLGKQVKEVKSEVGDAAWYAQMLASRSFSVMLIGIFSLLLIFKSHLGELKSISYVFLTVVGLFITLMVMELSRDDGANRPDYADMTSTKVDAHLPAAISILLFAYAFQFMVFPAYTELENRSNSRFLVSSMWSLIIYTTAMISTGIIAVLLFGKTVKTDLLENIGARSSGLSIFIRIIYCLILLFHLPYIFFALKEYVLVLYEELTVNKLTLNLETKLRKHELD